MNINFPDNPQVGDGFQVGSTIFRCIQVTPVVVWTAFPADAGIPDAPVDGSIYGRQNGGWVLINPAAIGLGNVDNTSDANKPISNATAAALAGKEPTIAAGTAAQYWKGTKVWATLDKAAVGLPFVDNTADINKTVNSALFVRNGGSAAGQAIPFSWSDDGTQPNYIWGGNNVEGRVYYRPNLQVGYASSAGSAPANGGTAQNSNQVGGIGGWRYSGEGNNPPWLWSTDGNAQNQFLTSPSTLSVNYANSAGSAPANGGTSSNSNALAGQGPGYWINNANTALVNIRNNGTIQLIAGISGGGDFWWSINPSDRRLKTDILPTAEDSLDMIDQMKFVSYRFRTDMPWLESPNDPEDHPKTWAVDDGRFHSCGVIADEAEVVSPNWIGHEGTYAQLHVNEMLMSAMHAIQQLHKKVKALQS